MSPAAKRYSFRIAGAAGAYAGAVVGVNALDAGFALDAPVRVGLALLPVLPALYGLWAALQFVRAMDEVQARIISEAMLVSALIVGFASFTYGFLEGALALPDISMIWVLPALLGVMGVAQVFVRMRYQ
ncbi:hypothetical protein DDZ18_10390 [Marinicauda salina]|uniref:Uncharacterized protein n=1 Tax=Marinicauda salina TaxID=2135793 RepID=A0A2U2BSW1_9PROT|nr:hypothetical protein [Marinicauda salina]PWE17099.1 hypothetical protein DDZ18_10390 [Marinicauda salina]